MKKCVLFAFNGELLCFVHVLLNGLDMKDKGYETGVIFEGSSVKLVEQLAKPENPFHQLYQKAKDTGLILGACKACSAKLGALEAVQAEGIALLGDMSGHPSMSGFIDQGFEVITF